MWGTASSLLGFLERLFRGRVALGAKGVAKVCNYDHVPIVLTGEDMSRRTQPDHLDVELELWNRGSEAFSLLPGVEARSESQRLRQGSDMINREFGGAEFPVGGPRQTVYFYLRPVEGEVLRSGPGDAIVLEFTPTRGRQKKRVEILVKKERRRA